MSEILQKFGNEKEVTRVRGATCNKAFPKGLLVEEYCDGCLELRAGTCRCLISIMTGDGHHASIDAMFMKVILGKKLSKENPLHIDPQMNPQLPKQVAK